MKDLISRQAAIDAIKNLPSIQTIDPVKHGKWLKIEGCNTANYCPNCGAKMQRSEE